MVVQIYTGLTYKLNYTCKQAALPWHDYMDTVTMPGSAKWLLVTQCDIEKTNTATISKCSSSMRKIKSKGRQVIG